MKVFVFAILLVQFTSELCEAQSSMAERRQKILDLQNRLQELEKKQENFDQWQTDFYNLGRGSVKPFFGEKIAIGGFFETGLINIYGPDTEYQISANNHVLGFNISADYSEKLRFVAQTLTTVSIPLANPNNNPSLTPTQRKYQGLSGGTLVAQVFFEYDHSDFFHIQTGLGYMPFGIAYQQREPYLFHPRNGPQLINNDDGFNIAIVSALWLGVHMYGLFPLAQTVGYNLYTLTPGSNVASLGCGGRLWWAINENIKTGVSVQYAERRMGSYVATGVDLELKYEKFGFLGEYAINNSALSVPDSEYYYVEPYISVFENKWIFYVSAEYFRSPNRLDILTLTPDPFEQKYYGTGVNWLPIPNAKLRLGFLKHDYINDPPNITRNRDYDAVEFSTAVAF